MSNTTTRILSGIFLILIVVFCLIRGPQASLIGIGSIGVFVIDEVITNFYEQSRASLRYVFAQAFYILGFYFFNFYQISQSSFSIGISTGIFLNILLLGYLFFIHKKSDNVLKIFKMTSWGIGLVTLIPLLCLSYIIHFESWKLFFVALLILNFMVDTAAYFTGKKFGKHKLWEAVSPKKTIEGAIGGVVCSIIATCIFWQAYIGKVTWITVLVFFIIACCSQLGDLVQSKLKRQFEIKDSSSLIPGHGGVYDRVDSLLFVAPLYAFFIMAYFK